MTNWETVLVVCSHCRMIRLKQTSTPLRVETLGGLFEVSCNKVVTNACQVIWKNKTNTYFILQCYKPFFQGVGLHCWRHENLIHQLIITFFFQAPSPLSIFCTSSPLFSSPQPVFLLLLLPHFPLLLDQIFLPPFMILFFALHSPTYFIRLPFFLSSLLSHFISITVWTLKANCSWWAIRVSLCTISVCVWGDVFLCTDGYICV